MDYKPREFTQRDGLGDETLAGSGLWHLKGALGGCIEGGIRHGIFVVTLDKNHIEYASLGLQPFVRINPLEVCVHKESVLKPVPQPRAQANARTTTIRNI